MLDYYFLFIFLYHMDYSYTSSAMAGSNDVIAKTMPSERTNKLMNE